MNEKDSEIIFVLVVEPGELLLLHCCGRCRACGGCYQCCCSMILIFVEVIIGRSCKDTFTYSSLL